MESIQKFRTVIVDDERLSRQDLISLLSEFDCFEIVGEAEDVNSALECINVHSPDVLFLDIQLPGETGFELLEKADYSGRVVFVTAFNEHAIRAFEVNALDYLLKPVSRKRIQNTIDRLLSGIKPEHEQKELTQEDRLFVMFGNQMKFLRVADIICIQAYGDYSKVSLSGKGSGLVLKTMAEWEKRLPPEFFIRVHKSAIINMEFVEKVEKYMNYSYILFLKDQKDPVIMSRRYAKLIKKRLG